MEKKEKLKLENYLIIDVPIGIEKENIRIFKKNFKDEKTGEYKQEYEFVLNSVKVNQEGISSATDFSIQKNRNDLKKLA